MSNATTIALLDKIAAKIELSVAVCKLTQPEAVRLGLRCRKMGDTHGSKSHRLIDAYYRRQDAALKTWARGFVAQGKNPVSV